MGSRAEPNLRSARTVGAVSVDEYERRAEYPLLILAVVFLAAYAWPVLDPRLDPDLDTSLEIAAWAVWAVFLVDFVVRLWLTSERWAYAMSHWYDVALIALPMLRPLRLLRLLALARILHRSASSSLVGRVGIYVGGVAVMAVGLGALAVLDAEQDAEGANITNYADALWWACTTVSTVGYGDHFPVTTSGRFLAVGLMIVGIAVIGVVTASVAAWLVSSVQDDATSHS